MRYRCAVLDDYQNIALKLADWSKVAADIEIKVFDAPIGDDAAVAEALHGFAIVCLMRERTSLGRTVIERLPDLKLIVTTGMRNAAIDMLAAKERGILVCGTSSAGHPTAELTFGLLLDLARHISFEHARMKAGEAWQVTVGKDLSGKTLGVIGLGKLGTRVARIARTFEMRVVAWSQNLTPEKCKEAGVEYATKEALLAQSDFVTIHLQLSPRTKGLIGVADIAGMKPTAYLINTSRGPIVDEAALIAALRGNTIAGAAVDVYDVEPLPRDHIFRKLPNLLMTPHLGYVTEDNLRIFYRETIENIRAFLDGKPVRVIA
jgi:phosphoglycerate dehydrogenase-like enzyme